MLMWLMNMDFAGGAASTSTADSSAMHYAYRFRQGWVHMLAMVLGG